MQPRPLRFFSLSCLLLSLLLGGCATTKEDRGGAVKAKVGGKGTLRPYTINGITYYPIPSAQGFQEEGLASWYGGVFHGRKTANGETYDMYGPTAAHKTLPMNTMLLVRNLDNGKESVVRINDRGPFVEDRVIDLSYSKAEELGIIGPGTARVELIALEQRQDLPQRDGKKGYQRPDTPEAPKGKQFTEGNFFVQVGAFAERKDARLEAIRFSARGRDVIIQQYNASGRGLYRVLVFGGHSLATAQKYRQALARAGYKDPLVIAR